jgi:hypothetical protein
MLLPLSDLPKDFFQMLHLFCQVFVDYELLTDPLVDLLQVFDGSPVELLQFLEIQVLLLSFYFLDDFFLQSIHRCLELRLPGFTFKVRLLF